LRKSQEKETVIHAILQCVLDNGFRATIGASNDVVIGIPDTKFGKSGIHVSYKAGEIEISTTFMRPLGTTHSTIGDIDIHEPDCFQKMLEAVEIYCEEHAKNDRTMGRWYSYKETYLGG
jgi:hypothetical protein